MYFEHCLFETIMGLFNQFEQAHFLLYIFFSFVFGSILQFLISSFFLFSHLNPALEPILILNCCNEHKLMFIIKIIYQIVVGNITEKSLFKSVGRSAKIWIVFIGINFLLLNEVKCFFKKNYICSQKCRYFLTYT